MLGTERYIRINSEERENPTATSSNDFRVSFRNAAELMNVNRIVIKGVSIPNVQYNVRVAAGLNPVGNVFSYNNGTLQTITVPVGQYTSAQLIAYINADAQAVADGLVVSLDATTKKYTFVSTTAIAYLSLASGNNMATIFGITADSGAAALSFSAQGLPNLLPHPNIFISSSALSDGSNMISPTLSSIPVCAVVPADVAWGEIIHYTSKQEHLDDIHYPSFQNGKSLQAIDLKVFDGDANLIDLQGLDWTIILKIYQSPR